MSSTKTSAQLDREIAEYLANPRLGDPKWEREWADLLEEKHSKARVPTVDELARALQYVEREFNVDDGRIDGEQWAEGLAFGKYPGDATARRIAREVLSQLSNAEWLRIAARANALSREQREPARYLK